MLPYLVILYMEQQEICSVCQRNLLQVRELEFSNYAPAAKF